MSVRSPAWLVVAFGTGAFGSACQRSVLGNPNDQTSPVPKVNNQTDFAPVTKDEAERQAEEVVARVGPAFVKVEHESGRHLGGDAAVIVSAEGHVVYQAVSGGGKKTFLLPDGRRAVGTHLGWSAEWGVGLVKLDGPGPWPHVELSRSDGIKGGQWAVSLGYPRLDPAQDPLVTVEPVSGSATGRWFVLNDGHLTVERNTPAVFDLDGRLVGVVSKTYLNGPGGLGTVYTDAKVVRELWEHLAAGKNVDELRLRAASPAGGGDRPAPALTPEVEARVKAASVRIRLNAEDQAWSGTIVTPDGVIITCAHGLNFVPAGTKVSVGLPDGRDVTGEVVGYNHVCDVCVIKISEKGPWPHVEAGSSTRMRAGDPCFMMGYGEIPSNDRQPRVRRTSVVKQWDAHWSGDLDLDPKIEWVGGDSGGGVFDADGRLVAYFVGGRPPGEPQIGRRIELFSVHRAEMAGPYEQATLRPAPAGEPKPNG